MKLKSEDDELFYFPIDLSFCVRRFIRNVRPKSVILLETEIWPNLLAELKREGAEVFVLNGRISDRAMPRYLRSRWLLKPFFSLPDRILVQDELMRVRYLMMGAEPDRLEVTGNMKFDWMPAKADQEFLRQIEQMIARSRSIIWVAGSTHEGEEKILFEVYRKLKVEFPDLALILAPRHLNRLDAIEVQARQKNISVHYLSSGKIIEGSKPWPKVFLLDRMGVLSSIYSAADLVFVGGSLVPIGGHNLVEPAFFEKAIVHGAFMQNFKEMTDEFLSHNASIQVHNAKELELSVRRLILHEDERRAFGLRAKKLIQKHQGATIRNIDKLFSVSQVLS